jgi:hypothetical protein
MEILEHIHKLEEEIRIDKEKNDDSDGFSYYYNNELHRKLYNTMYQYAKENYVGKCLKYFADPTYVFVKDIIKPNISTMAFNISGIFIKDNCLITHYIQEMNIAIDRITIISLDEFKNKLNELFNGINNDIKSYSK